MDANSLEVLQKLNQPMAEQRVIDASSRRNGDRLEALREAAFGVGARGGLVSESKLINKVVDTHARNLDVIFDFKPLMIKGRVIPPVLTETREIYSQGDATNLRLAGISYKVETQARFSSRPPSWRDYLPMNFVEVTMPSSVLYPRTADEQEVWKKTVAEGWAQGQQQANDIFTANRNRLLRDYRGMTRYHILALKNMVTIPRVAEQSMPINATTNSMYLDETVLRITALPEFNANMKNWAPLGQEVSVTQSNGSPESIRDGK